MKGYIKQDGIPTPDKPQKIKNLVVNKEAKELIEKQSKEIERLNKELTEEKEVSQALANSNVMLSNIINELEKIFKRDLESILDFEEKNPEAILSRFPEYYLEQLQELKGSDKELKNCTKESQNDAIENNDDAIKGEH